MLNDVRMKPDPVAEVSCGGTCLENETAKSSGFGRYKRCTMTKAAMTRDWHLKPLAIVLQPRIGVAECIVVGVAGHGA